MSEHTIKCRETGEPLANKLDGGECVCKPGECEMRKMRNNEGDYVRKSESDDSFDAVGFAIGMATGFPISPRGITMGSIIGSLLHPTERHAAYDVTSATPTIPTDDTQPGTPAAPVRDPDWSDNAREVAPRYADPAPQPIDTAPPARDPDPAPFAPADDYKPSYESPPSTPEPSYSAPAPDPTPAPSYDPAPSYSAPDPSPPSYDSGGGGFSGGSTDP